MLDQLGAADPVEAGPDLDPRTEPTADPPADWLPVDPVAGTCAIHRKEPKRTEEPGLDSHPEPRPAMCRPGQVLKGKHLFSSSQCLSNHCWMHVGFHK